VDAQSPVSDDLLEDLLLSKRALQALFRERTTVAIVLAEWIRMGQLSMPAVRHLRRTIAEYDNRYTTPRSNTVHD
jgi:hypothetical protein